MNKSISVIVPVMDTKPHYLLCSPSGELSHITNDQWAGTGLGSSLCRTAEEKLSSVEHERLGSVGLWLQAAKCVASPEALEAFLASLVSMGFPDYRITLAGLTAARPVRRQSVLQPWVERLPLMQQTVLLTAVRGPDGLRNDHPSKIVLRWLRRSVLVSALDGNMFQDPFEPGGGSFTGPFTRTHVAQVAPGASFPEYDEQSAYSRNAWWGLFNAAKKAFTKNHDDLPVHFLMHVMHAAEVIGYKHENDAIAKWWLTFYDEIVNSLHLSPETEAQMDYRLGDKEEQWRACEEGVAKPGMTNAQADPIVRMLVEEEAQDAKRRENAWQQLKSNPNLKP